MKERAVDLLSEKIEYPDGSIREMVLWKLPRPSKDRPHGFKYRLHYKHQGGLTWVRYDNERGKGDHRHIGDKEEPYVFRNPGQLVRDFLADIARIRREEP